MLCNTAIDTGLGLATGGGGGGGVSSVGLAMPASLFTVSGSPVTTSGTLTATLITQTANRILAGPTSGVPALPTFRQLVAEDMNPTYSNGQVLQTNGSGVLSWATVGGSGTVTSVGLSLPSELTVSGSPVTTSGTLTAVWASVGSRRIFAAPPTASGVPTFLHIQAEHLNPTYTNGQVLQTNGSGTLSWVTPSGSPAGTTNGQIQYKNGSVFGANSALFWDVTNNWLQVSGSSVAVLGIGTLGDSQALQGKRSGAPTSLNNTPGILNLFMTDSNITTVITIGYNAVALSAGANALTVYSDGRTKWRGAVGAWLPTNGIIEMPWVTGDTLPTLYLGSNSSTSGFSSVPLRVQVGSGAGIYVTANTLGGYGVYSQVLDSNCYSFYASITGNSHGLYIAEQTTITRSIPYLQIDMVNTSGTFNAVLLSNLGVNYFTVNQNGVLSVRSGLDTGNKMTEVGGQFFTNTTDASNSGSGETDLGNISIPANILGTNGDRIEIEASFEFAANSNTKTVKVYFGATVILSFSGSNSGSAGTAVVRGAVIRDTAGGSEQIAYATFNGSNLPTAAGGNCTLPAETLSSAITVKCTGQGGASNDITQKSFSVKWFPKGQI